MPAAVAIPLITAGASAGASIIGGKLQAGANEDAATKQLQANQAALDFAKQRYAQSQVNQAPYMAGGRAASGGISDVLAKSAQRSGYSYVPAQQLVTLRAPDGSTKQVPQEQAQHWIGLGAVQV